MTEQHPDPIAEGLAQGGQRIIQILALGIASKQMYSGFVQKREAAEAARDRAAAAQADADQRAAFDQARAIWAPAHDRQWLQNADILKVAQAWGAAAPFAAEGHPGAASAVDKCEQRLRDLHPHAMSHYDRLRASGQDPLAAMRQATPFFNRDPNVREGHPVSTAALKEGTGARWAANPHGPSRQEWEAARQERRAHQIIDEFQARMRDRSGPELLPLQMRTLLETVTNLPEPIIAKVVQTRTAPDSNRSDQTRTPSEVSADDFPQLITEAIYGIRSTLAQTGRPTPHLPGARPDHPKP
ncbi:hypothetical protein ACGFNU_44340 [Spirillospora sp. NPDC048911]|uniref:hypothetical protein n=1 Tax=Spirillospora sp. NPDC048911 TaxID=3364527 RepID=UPI00371D55C7